MLKFIENVNMYIGAMKIKQTYVSFKSGINTSTLSRILNGGREISYSEMERISKALGQKMEYFLNENFSLPSEPELSIGAVFYVGEPSKEQEKFAAQVLDLIKNVDEVLSARERFIHMIGE